MLYKTIYRPVLTYRSETESLTKSETKQQAIFEFKGLRSAVETVRNRMEFYQDCVGDVVKSLRCSAAKHPVRNEQYVVGHCHGAIGSHFGAMDVSF
ncbi:hypothetical protein TNCV_1480851 [Trichonephila clavipes]|nr:hypothetical protein TNCV_1480851 [Trichonephila clavipes]